MEVQLCHVPVVWTPKSPCPLALGAAAWELALAVERCRLCSVMLWFQAHFLTSQSLSHLVCEMGMWVAIVVPHRESQDGDFMSSSASPA